jgi:hypothetical protein
MVMMMTMMSSSAWQWIVPHGEQSQSHMNSEEIAEAFSVLRISSHHQC